VAAKNENLPMIEMARLELSAAAAAACNFVCKLMSVVATSTSAPRGLASTTNLTCADVSGPFLSPRNLQCLTRLVAIDHRSSSALRAVGPHRSDHDRLGDRAGLPRRHVGGESHYHLVNRLIYGVARSDVAAHSETIGH
jgi:hypothetical protein